MKTLIALFFALVSLCASAQVAQLPNAIPVVGDGGKVVDLEINQAILMQYCNPSGTICLPPFSPTRFPLNGEPDIALWSGPSVLFAIKGPHWYKVHFTTKDNSIPTIITVGAVVSARPVHPRQ